MKVYIVVRNDNSCGTEYRAVDAVFSNERKAYDYVGGLFRDYDVEEFNVDCEEIYNNKNSILLTLIKLRKSPFEYVATLEDKEVLFDPFVGCAIVEDSDTDIGFYEQFIGHWFVLSKNCLIATTGNTCYCPNRRDILDTSFPDFDKIQSEV